MSFWENILESFGSLYANLLRTFLTILGVIFGVSAVISMMAIGEGAEKEIMDMINRFGSKNIHINGKDIARTNLKNIIDKSSGLTPQDADLLTREFDFIEDISLFTNLTVRTINHQIEGEKLQLWGSSPNYLSMMNIKLQSGRGFLPKENEEFKQYEIKY